MRGLGDDGCAPDGRLPKADTLLRQAASGLRDRPQVGGRVDGPGLEAALSATRGRGAVALAADVGQGGATPGFPSSSRSVVGTVTAPPTSWGRDASATQAVGDSFDPAPILTPSRRVTGSQRADGKRRGLASEGAQIAGSVAPCGSDGQSAMMSEPCAPGLITVGRFRFAVGTHTADRINRKRESNPPRISSLVREGPRRCGQRYAFVTLARAYLSRDPDLRLLFSAAAPLAKRASSPTKEEPPAVACERARTLSSPSARTRSEGDKAPRAAAQASSRRSRRGRSMSGSPAGTPIVTWIAQPSSNGLRTGCAPSRLGGV